MWFTGKSKSECSSGSRDKASTTNAQFNDSSMLHVASKEFPETSLSRNVFLASLYVVSMCFPNELEYVRVQLEAFQNRFARSQLSRGPRRLPSE